MIDDIREIVHIQQLDRALTRESYNTLFQYIDNDEFGALNSSSINEVVGYMKIVNL